MDEYIDYIFLGWYDSDMEYKYLEEFTSYYHENLDVYCRWFKNGKTNINLTYKITDSGRFNQKYDTINLYELLNISVFDLKEYRYNKLTLTIKITLKEIDEGNQFIFIFKRADKDNDYLIDSIELSGVTKTLSEKTISFTFDIDELDSDMIFIRFGASGKFDDDWQTTIRKYEVRVVK